MPAESIKVCPPELLASAGASARVLDNAATPALGGTPSSSGGASAADVAGAIVAAGIGLLEHDFSLASAPNGQAVEFTTQAGVAQLQSQDEFNVAALRAVARER